MAREQAKREGKPVGRRATFITTLTGLCVYSATVALAYRLPSALRSSTTPERTSCTLRNLFPARNSRHVGWPSGSAVASTPVTWATLREKIFHFIRYGQRSRLRSVSFSSYSCPLFSEYHFVAVYLHYSLLLSVMWLFFDIFLFWSVSSSRIWKVCAILILFFN